MLAPRIDSDGFEEECKEEDLDVSFEEEMCPVIIEGFLSKRKQKGLRMGVWNWQNRFCILDNMAKCLRYGAEETAEDWRMVPFKEIQRVYSSSGPLEFCVELSSFAGNKNASRIFVFKAQDPVDARNWIMALKGISIEGKDWAGRSRRVSKIIEEKVARMHSAKKSTEFDPNQTVSLKSKIETFEIETPVMNQEPHLRGLTKRIIAHANERRIATQNRAKERARRGRRQCADKSVTSQPPEELRSRKLRWIFFQCCISAPPLPEDE